MAQETRVKRKRFTADGAVLAGGTGSIYVKELKLTADSVGACTVTLETSGATELVKFIAAIPTSSSVRVIWEKPLDCGDTLGITIDDEANLGEGFVYYQYEGDTV